MVCMLTYDQLCRKNEYRRAVRVKDEELVKRLEEEFKDDLVIIKIACEQDLEEENARIEAAYQKGYRKGMTLAMLKRNCSIKEIVGKTKLSVETVESLRNT